MCVYQRTEKPPLSPRNAKGICLCTEMRPWRWCMWVLEGRAGGWEYAYCSTSCTLTRVFLVVVGSGLCLTSPSSILFAHCHSY
ncbi:hypothetical protein K505DRAFT_21042 [Melanomma pulvis-pyrius CBS 109.77]|uniref:Uncharacterized protein n=1 Tax=Melanomma pulvis-pyrius CBS 109.77 TaxID=1314802 RepID=A0A6A6XUJ6_9PLEO|nr:hypothetical protein K505DRAFT_21042 [Melanomma pulvis-pyrius CBS 109.77]